MTMRDFIRMNREEIDAAIRYALDHIPASASCHCPKSGTDHYHAPEVRLNNRERELWVRNNEGLYSMARRSGVRF